MQPVRAASGGDDRGAAAAHVRTGTHIPPQPPSHSPPSPSQQQQPTAQRHASHETQPSAFSWGFQPANLFHLHPPPPPGPALLAAPCPLFSNQWSEDRTPCVTFRLVVAPLRGPGQSPVLPFACCVGSLRSVGCCGRCSCWCRFRVRGAPPPPPPIGADRIDSTRLKDVAFVLSFIQNSFVGIFKHLLQKLSKIVLFVDSCQRKEGPERRAHTERGPARRGPPHTSSPLKTSALVAGRQPSVTAPMIAVSGPPTAAGWRPPRRTTGRGGSTAVCRSSTRVPVRQCRR